jgi:hypothetical protein
VPFLEVLLDLGGGMTDSILGDSPIAFEKAKGHVPTSALMYDALQRLTPEPAPILGEGTVARLNQRLLDTAGLLARSPLLVDPPERADAFHYVLTTLHAAIDHSILQTDTTEPMFSPVMPTHRVDWGARNPDGVYRKAYVSPERSYRIYGRVGNAKYFTFDFVGASYDREVGYGVSVDELEADGDGNFELHLGGAERPDRWYPMRPWVQAVTTREFFDDWSAAERSVLRIDCVDDDVLTRTELPPRPEHSAARVATEFDVIGDWLYEAGVRFWLEEWHSEENIGSTTNRFKDFYRTESKRPTVCRGCWHLEDDEALLLELPDPRARYWGIQTASVLVHTLDFAARLASINNAQARVDDDGLVRIVVSHRDPGVHNWLDTTGLRHGDLMMRVHEGSQLAPPSTKVVKLRELPDIVPEAATVTAEERRTQIRARREGVAHLFCD